MVLQLISATPSPYARKVRIQLSEKGIPYELKNEVPWDKTTETPQHNPLEKLPILIFDDGREPIYESHFIIEYVEQKFDPQNSLTPTDVDTALKAKQLEVLSDSICDALVLTFFEKQRDEDKRSQEWLDRQVRKIEGGLKALNDFITTTNNNNENNNNGQSECFAMSRFQDGDKLSIADVAIVSMVDFLLLNKYPAMDGEKFVELKSYAEKLNCTRPAFKETMPYMFEIKDKVV